MSKDYKEAIKGTTIFGGLKIITIILSVIKSKAIALLIGPIGFGINSILNSTINLVRLITGLGIEQSGVKEVSEVKDDLYLLSKKVHTVRFFSWITGIAGFIFLLVLSPLISLWTFDSYDYTKTYILVSPTILFLSLYSAELTILRAIRSIKQIVKASIIISVLGLFFAIPMYYFFKINGIVFVILFSSLLSYIIILFFSKKNKVLKYRSNFIDSWNKGSKLIKLGISMSLGNVIGSMSTFLIIIIIINLNGVLEVGLYNAGWSITNQYLSLIFSAMAADYLPRLSAVSNNNLKIKECINNQAEIASLIIAPLLCVLLICLPLVINLLFSNEFSSIVSFTRILFFGIFFQSFSWSISYVFIAKGDGALYVKTQLSISVIKLLLMSIGYFYGQLIGLSLGYFLVQLLYLIYMWSIAYKKYNFNFNKSLIYINFKHFILMLLISIFIYLSKLYSNYELYFIFVAIIITIESIRISFNKLNEKLSIKEFLKNYISFK